MGRFLSRARWIWITAGAVVVGLVVAGVTAPRWATPMLVERVLARVQARTGAVVEAKAVKATWSHVTVAELSVRHPEGPELELRNLRAALDWSDLRSGDVRVSSLSAEQGELRGSLRISKRRPPAQKGVAALGRGGTSAPAASQLWPHVPAKIEVPRLRVDVADVPGVGRLAARVDLTWAGQTPGHGTLRAQGRELRVPDLPRAARASAVSASVEIANGKPAFPLEVRVEGGAFEVTPTIAVAGAQGTVTLEDGAGEWLRVALAGGFADVRQEGGAVVPLWSVEGRVRRDRSEGQLKLNMDEFELGRVPDVLAALPLEDSAAASVGGSVTIGFHGGVVEVGGDVELRGIHVRHPLLASNTVHDAGFQASFQSRWDPVTRVLQVPSAELRRADVIARLQGSAALTLNPKTRAYSLKLAIPKVHCQAMLDALPADLVPSLQGFRFTGDFAFDAEVEVDMADLDELRLSGSVDWHRCRVRGAPDGVSATRLAGPFVHRVVMRDGSSRRLELFPGSPHFVSITRVSPHMIGAVLTTEDGGFYHHRGFLPSQFAEALRKNLEAGRVRLGASTISMQTVKNVLLSHERTLSRKLQEFVLTWYIEKVLTKDRILELYFNVVEFGPGVYGLRAAAQRYFGKEPADLNPPEAAYLALLLPSPVRRSVHHCRGRLSPRYRAKVARVLRIMKAKGRLSAEDYEGWKDTELVFEPPTAGAEACETQIGRLLDAHNRQRALSGLLGDDHEPIIVKDDDPETDDDPSNPDTSEAVPEADR